MKKKVIAVIPAYNEENTIGTVIQNLKQFVNEIIVVNDGSSDNTAQIAESNSAIVITNKINQGYDKTIDKGFKVAEKHDASVIFTFDADGQHDASDIPHLVNPILQNKADIVVGIRPYKQRVSESIFSKYSKLRIGIIDPLCGMKAYSIKAYKTIGYFDNINSIGTELMFRSYKLGFRIIQVPVNMNRRNEETPRFGNKIRSNLKILKAMFKIIILVN